MQIPPTLTVTKPTLTLTLVGYLRIGMKEVDVQILVQKLAAAKYASAEHQDGPDSDAELHSDSLHPHQSQTPPTPPKTPAHGIGSIGTQDTENTVPSSITADRRACTLTGRHRTPLHTLHASAHAASLFTCYLEAAQSLSMPSNALGVPLGPPGPPCLLSPESPCPGSHTDLVVSCRGPGSDHAQKPNVGGHSLLPLCA